MDVKDVAEFAALLKEEYSPEALAPVAAQPTVERSEPNDRPDGWWAVEVPTKDQLQPWLSFRLIDAAALGTTLVITFWWDDGADEETIYVMPLDTRDVDFPMSDNLAVTNYLSHSIEFAIGGRRESWEGRTFRVGPRMAVVRPHQWR